MALFLRSREEEYMILFYNTYENQCMLIIIVKQYLYYYF